MKAKIEWYQEVLELEPGSKVFFPLGRLFAETEQYAEAVATLRQGLEKHPEHFEARLLLIECLDRLDAKDSFGSEVATLGGMLSQYPGFWSAWAKNVQETPSGDSSERTITRDAAIALRFLAASFADGSVSWTDVLEKGLVAVLGGFDTAAGASPSGFRTAAGVQEKAARPSETSEQRDTTPEYPDAPAHETLTATAPIPEVGEGHESAAEQPAPSSRALGNVQDTLQGEAFQVEDDEDESEDEVFSLRTLSMARVLAEPGDTREALEICQELANAAETPEELAPITALRESLEAGIAPVTGDDADGAPLQAKHRLINTLESLAERLEARASV